MPGFHDPFATLLVAMSVGVGSQALHAMTKLGGRQMVFLAMTRSGYATYTALGSEAGALWVSAGVLSDEELAALRQLGVDVSDFDYEILPHEFDAIAGALETIKEHHPGEPVWVDGKPV